MLRRLLQSDDDDDGTFAIVVIMTLATIVCTIIVLNKVRRCLAPLFLPAAHSPRTSRAHRR